MRRASPIVREAAIQAACIEWLKWHGWSVLRLNSGKVHVEGRCITLCPEGTPDTVAFQPSEHGQGIVRLIFIEFKRVDKHPTFKQYVRMEELKHYGALCWVISSVEELEHKLEHL